MHRYGEGGQTEKLCLDLRDRTTYQRERKNVIINMFPLYQTLRGCVTGKNQGPTGPHLTGQ